MKAMCRFPTILFAALMVSLLLPSHDLAAAGGANLAGYYAREQNDGELARASRKSHYIRFYPENRVVRLVIPFPYATTLDPDTLRAVFRRAAGRTRGSAYISDTFGVLDRKVIAHIDFVRRMDGRTLFDCDRAIPCTMEFDDGSMRIIKQGLIRDHVTSYAFVPD